MNNTLSSRLRAAHAISAAHPHKVMRLFVAFGAVVAIFAIAGCAKGRLQLETVLPPIPVKSNASAFATPLAYRNGAVYAVTVEAGAEPVPMHELGLHTVVRRATRVGPGHWRWQSNTVATDTARDPYHNQGSIALDKNGYVHVVYDMHYFPWQYSVSSRPDSIDEFVFRGQRASPAKRRAAQAKPSVIDFPGRGSAAIPGNQVTYPAFFTDRNDTLYVTYRYAVRPKRSWYDRVFAGAIARYDADSRTWNQIGGEIKQGPDDVELISKTDTARTHPFAMEPGWWVYQPRLAFDRDNGMHVSWLWREGNAGLDSTHPSYAYSPAGSDRFFRSDGSAYDLPIRLHAAEKIAPEALTPLSPEGFYNPARMSVTEAGNPVLSIQPIDNQQYALRMKDNGKWHDPVPIPDNAWQIFFDDESQEWAFASGLRVSQREVDPDGRPQSDWKVVFKGNEHNGGDNLCYPRVVRGAQDDEFFIYANVLNEGECREDRVTIVRLFRK